MSPDKTKELKAIYPELFSCKSDQLCINLFGFECGDGWFELLKDLITEIKHICELDKATDLVGLQDDPEQLVATQVKEKYGTLRFYTSWANDAIDEAITKADKRSALTCEECGKPGKIREIYSRWYKTVCEECFKGRSSRWESSV